MLITTPPSKRVLKKLKGTYNHSFDINNRMVGESRKRSENDGGETQPLGKFLLYN